MFKFSAVHLHLPCLLMGAQTLMMGLTWNWFQQNRSSLLEERRSVLSQQFRLLKPQIRGPAQNHQNGTTWVQNGRQDTRIGQNESYSGSGASPTGPVAKNLPKKARNPEIGLSGPPLSGSTPVEGPLNRTPLVWGPMQGSYLTPACS